MNKKKFKLPHKIAPLDGFTSANDWIEHTLKTIDLHYENEKQQGKLNLKKIEYLKIGRLVTLGSILEEIKPSDFNSKKQYDRTITHLYKNFFAFHVIPTLQDDILKKSDIRIIPVLGEIFSYNNLIYTRKNPHKYDMIDISGDEYPDMIPIEQVFCYTSPSIEFDISAKLEAFFFGEEHRLNKSIIFRFIESMYIDENYSQSEILKRERSKRKVDKCLEVGVSYIKTVLGEDYFNQLIQETINKMEDGLYVRLLNGLQPKKATQHEVIFKGLLNQLLPYIDDDDLKNEVQLHILLN